VFQSWINFFKRSPRAGEGKDLTMSHPTESPGTPAPGNAPDVSRQIAELTAAVNQLVQAQKQHPNPHDQRVAPASSIAVAPDVGGEIPGGEALLPGVDYSKLSPLQQITLGLRDAKPVGPARPGVVQSRANHTRELPDERPAHGAD
jgi:hypothetical protein